MAEMRHAAVRIPTLVGIGMIIVAVVFDGLQFFLSFFHVVPWAGSALATVANVFIAFLAYIIFGLWFASLNVNFFGGKRAAVKLLAVFGTLVIEILPLIDALPAILAGVMTMIAATRIEDTIGNKETLEKMQRERAAREAQAQTLEQRRLIAARTAVEQRNMAEAVLSNRAYRAPSEEEFQDEQATGNASASVEDMGARAQRIAEAARPFNLEERGPERYGKKTAASQASYKTWQERTAASLRQVRGRRIGE